MPFHRYEDLPATQLLDIANRRVVITGAGRSIGFAIAQRFAECGASVLLADIDAEAAETAARQLHGLPGTVRAVASDASDSAQQDDLAQRAIDEFGGIDVWVNNAGIYPYNEFGEMTDAQWRRVMALNLDGVFWGCRAAARMMRRAGEGGCIINIASTSAFGAGIQGLAHYTASKHGVVGITKSAALELGPHGIRVLALAPTAIAAERRAEEQPASTEENRGPTPEEYYAARLPAGRVGYPDDVARVALFCASSLAGFITGVTIPVDGGQLAMIRGISR